MAQGSPSEALGGRAGPAVWAWLAVVLLVALAATLWRLEGGTFHVSDEGLYGKFARNLAVHGQYLYAVNNEGEYTRQLCKPPFMIWMVAASFKLLGHSLWSLRLPTALSVVALAGVCFAWGRRLGGLRFGVTWALTLVLSGATLEWGRLASIEPVFVLWVLSALWAYDGATRTRGRAQLGWAALAGGSLALAFLTKQLAVGLGVLPIVIVEGLTLARLRRRGAPARGVARRLAVAMGIPAAAAGVWSALAYRQVGPPLFEVMIERSIGSRLAGFDDGVHARSLNELTALMDTAFAPFGWLAGVVGLLLLALAMRARRAGEPDDDGATRAAGPWLLPLWFLTSVLVFENVSQSLLPWYVYSFVPPLTAGVAWALAEGARLLTGSGERSELALVTALLGGYALLTGLVTAAGSVVSQLDVAVLLLALAVFALHRLRKRDEPRSAYPAALALALGFGVVGVWYFSSPSIHARAGRYGSLMRQLDERGVTRAAVARNTGLTAELQRFTLFGVGSDLLPKSAGDRPSRAPPEVEAFVTNAIPPREFVPPPEVELLRAPGAVAFVGSVHAVDWGVDALADMLDAGPVHFEAEHAYSVRPDSIRVDGDATVRAVVTPAREKPERVVLTTFPALVLRKGEYVATFRVRWECLRANRRAATLVVRTRGQAEIKRNLTCAAATPGEYQEVPVRFHVKGSTRGTSFHVVYESGSVLHDWTQLART